jgi:hypothetical protein
LLSPCVRLKAHLERLASAAADPIVPKRRAIWGGENQKNSPGLVVLDALSHELFRNADFLILSCLTDG